jgi:hypothetical protein
MHWKKLVAGVLAVWLQGSDGAIPVCSRELRGVPGREVLAPASRLVPESPSGENRPERRFENGPSERYRRYWKPLVDIYSHRALRKRFQKGELRLKDLLYGPDARRMLMVRPALIRTYLDFRRLRNEGYLFRKGYGRGFGPTRKTKRLFKSWDQDRAAGRSLRIDGFDVLRRSGIEAARSASGRLWRRIAERARKRFPSANKRRNSEEAGVETRKPDAFVRVRRTSPRESRLNKSKPPASRSRIDSRKRVKNVAIGRADEQYAGRTERPVPPDYSSGFKTAGPVSRRTERMPSFPDPRGERPLSRMKETAAAADRAHERGDIAEELFRLETLDREMRTSREETFESGGGEPFAFAAWLASRIERLKFEYLAELYGRHQKYPRDSGRYELRVGDLFRRVQLEAGRTTPARLLLSPRAERILAAWNTVKEEERYVTIELLERELGAGKSGEREEIRRLFEDEILVTLAPFIPELFLAETDKVNRNLEVFDRDLIETLLENHSYADSLIRGESLLPFYTDFPRRFEEGEIRFFGNLARYVSECTRAPLSRVSDHLERKLGFSREEFWKSIRIRDDFSVLADSAGVRIMRSGKAYPVYCHPRRVDFAKLEIHFQRVVKKMSVFLERGPFTRDAFRLEKAVLSNLRLYFRYFPEPGIFVIVFFDSAQETHDTNMRLKSDFEQFLVPFQEPGSFSELRKRVSLEILKFPNGRNPKGVFSRSS